MFVLRYCVCVSVSLLAVLTWNTGLTAQTVSSLEGKSEAEKLSLDPDNSQPRVTDIKQMQESSVSSQNTKNISTATGKRNNSPPNVLSQSGTSETPEKNSEPILQQLPPNNLNPNGNPLLRPSQPEDVEIDINEPLTLNEVIALALQNNREIQQARIEVEEVEARLVVERAALYPTLDIDSRLNREFIERQTGDFTGGPDIVVDSSETTGIFNVSLRQDIYAGEERDGRIKRAEREIRREELELEQIAENVRQEATDRYYSLQNSDAQVAIAQADVANASQTLRDAQLLEQAGLGTRFDVLRAEGDLATANQRLTSRIANQRIARRELAETLSLGQQVELVAADEIRQSPTWNLSLEETIVQAYKNRAELEQQLVRREISEQDVRIALAGITPRLDFVAQYGFDDDFDDGVGALPNWRFETRLTWRLFDGGRAFAGARAGNRGIDRATIEFTNIRNEIRLEVETAYYNSIANRENIDSTSANVRTREEGLRLARLRFQAGVGTQTDVINAQRDLSQARGDFLEAIINYNRSLNNLQRSVSNYPDNRLFEIR
ncbi:TolC family protein [Crocosphaera sp.]|uniref:TolC family protein n=1 Tax=Crocosphaera sp. TaxID=2729996 RepID=UPI0026238695|nr:TolC family protein [Crocosphaera sp.]MDJ0583341.1 TolC family protein [Crocosphaera sp.]